MTESEKENMLFRESPLSNRLESGDTSVQFNYGDSIHFYSIHGSMNVKGFYIFSEIWGIMGNNKTYLVMDTKSRMHRSSVGPDYPSMRINICRLVLTEKHLRIHNNEKF
jgi:hypothetical protein